MRDTQTPLLIGISGYNASGKTTLAKYLITHFDATSHRFSSVLADIARKLGTGTDKMSLQKLSTVLRTTLGEDVLARGICEWVKHTDTPVIVIEGIRRITDIQLLEKTALEAGRKWHLFFVDAPYEIRFTRINERLSAEGFPLVSKEEFHDLETQECEVELPEIKNRAHRTLNNGRNDAQETLKEAIEHIESNAT